MAPRSFSPILPVPHLQQPARGECLPACAAMVLAYLNAPVRYRRLFRLLRTAKGYGTPFSNIRELSRLKVAVLYEQGNLQRLHDFIAVGRPVLTPVNTGELPHWKENTEHVVVVAGLDEHSVYVNDPAFANAPIQISRGDFDLAWLVHNEMYAVLVP